MSVQELYDNGSIKFLYNKGMISIDILCYFDYYNYYQDLRSKGYNYTNAIHCTVDKFGCSISTVKRAIRTLK
jgi:hypothetical protein